VLKNSRRQVGFARPARARCIDVGCVAVLRCLLTKQSVRLGGLLGPRLAHVAPRRAGSDFAASGPFFNTLLVSPVDCERRITSEC